MPVICAACQTENRDAAKFCHGCARKLPGFAATGPSLLDGLRSKRPAAAAAAHPAGLAGQNAPREFWLGLGALMLAVAIGFGGWFGYVTRKVPAPAPASGAAPVAVAPPAPAQAAEARRPPEPMPQPVPLGSSLSAGEAEVTDKPPAPPPAVAAAPAPPPPTPAAVERRPAPTAPARAAALDPRQGCQNLNFFSAARCEAAHCDQPAYTRHPRCNEVRADRRRDEARRNPMLGT
ncbi:hypothetical protein QTI17_04645 [Variovorax sp. J31P179]|uniref:hypothetical protein n=1 Tax=Variovorax sp. J31P179 TaxID=3053508 RepID=UPI002578CD2A|nr:hypothetical protein [Variovorax sp. J31P179]MDM0079876.1 hypothetical protein [Variovorax sp. J31P179]